MFRLYFFHIFYLHLMAVNKQILKKTGFKNINKHQLYPFAFDLAIFTVLFNIAEGMVSTYLGYEDSSLALFGFGADSFIEVVSGLGIAHMVMRIHKRPASSRYHFERTALKITGLSFYV